MVYKKIYNVGVQVLVTLSHVLALILAIVALLPAAALSCVKGKSVLTENTRNIQESFIHCATPFTHRARQDSPSPQTSGFSAPPVIPHEAPLTPRPSRAAQATVLPSLRAAAPRSTAPVDASTLEFRAPSEASKTTASAASSPRSHRTGHSVATASAASSAHSPRGAAPTQPSPVPVSEIPRAAAAVAEPRYTEAQLRPFYNMVYALENRLSPVESTLVSSLIERVHRPIIPQLANIQYAVDPYMTLEGWNAQLNCNHHLSGAPNDASNNEFRYSVQEIPEGGQMTTSQRIDYILHSEEEGLLAVQLRVAFNPLFPVVCYECVVQKSQNNGHTYHRAAHYARLIPIEPRQAY